MKNSLFSKFKKLIVVFEYYIEKPWYEWALAFWVFIDVFILVIPTDGLLVSSVLLSPRKWLRLALLTAIGYTAGAVVFAYLVAQFGWPFLDSYFPEVSHSTSWIWISDLFQSYGMWLLFVVALAPIFQHPALILAALSHHSMAQIFWVFLAGRLIKYIVIAYVCRFAPGKISRLWGVEKELRELAVEKL